MKNVFRRALKTKAANLVPFADPRKKKGLQDVLALAVLHLHAADMSAPFPTLPLICLSLSLSPPTSLVSYSWSQCIATGAVTAQKVLRGCVLGIRLLTETLSIKICYSLGQPAAKGRRWQLELEGALQHQPEAPLESTPPMPSHTCS